MILELQTSYLVITFLLTLIVSIYLHITRNFNFWKNQNVPFIKPTVLFGNLFPVLSMKMMMAEFLLKIYNSTTSPFIGFFCFDQPFLLIRDPEIIKHMLIKEFDCFSNRTVAENKRYDKFGSLTLFALKNPVWRQARIKMTPIFTSGKLKNMTYLIIDVGKTLTEYLDEQILKNGEIYVRELAMKFSTDVITSCAFGLAANSFKEENAEFRQASRNLFGTSLPRAIQISSYFFAPFLVKPLRFKYFDSKSCDFMEKALVETMAERRKSKASRGDLIDLLLEIQDSNSESTELLDDDILICQGMQFFVAGYETTGSTIFFTLHELSFNLQIQERLRNEILAVVEKHQGITYDAVQSMPFLDMVISETLRKYPSLAFLDRRCTKDFKIPNSDVIIRKGLPVYISLLGLHNDPNYFPNPKKYDPERFSPESLNDKASSAYMPFGKGLRNCIGTRFALVSVKVALTALLRKYEVQCCDDTAYDIKFNPKGVMLGPVSDIKMRFKKIN